MTQLFANNAQSTVASLVGASDLIVQVASGEGSLFPTPGGGDYFDVTLTQAGDESSWEILKCTARSGDVLTVTRAQEGTVAATWGVGSKVELRLTAGVLWPAASGGTGLTAPGSIGNVLTSDGTTWASSPPATSGTVTSVNLIQPSAGITVSGGPITSSGSITLALNNDLAAVEGLSGLGLAARTGSSTWATRTLQFPAEGLVITDASGTAGDPTFVLQNDLAALEGLAGTGLAVRTATDTWAQRTVTGTAARITLTNGDGVSGNPTVDISASYVGQSSITTLGTVGTGVWQGSAVAANFGGTGFTSYAVGDLLFASTTSALSKLADVATGNALISGGVGVAPSWGKVGLTTHVSGTLPVANGGTGITALGTGVATFLGTPSSANLAAAVTDETGTGALVFANTPTLVTPDIGAATGTSVTISGSASAGNVVVTGSTAPANGMYLPAAGQIEFRSNSLRVMRINAQGALVLGFSQTTTQEFVMRTAAASAAEFSIITFGPTGFNRARLTVGGTTLNDGFLSFETLTSGTVSSEKMRLDSAGSLNIVLDNAELQLGAGKDLRLYHDGTDSYVRNDTGRLRLNAGATTQAQYDTTYFEFLTSMRASAASSPAQITSNQNDYAGLASTSFALRINSDAARDVTGLAGGVDGRLVWVTNVGTNNITLKNQNAGSSAANRFGFGADVVLGTDVSVLIRYDGTSSRWRSA